MLSQGRMWVLATALISGFAVYYNSIAVAGFDPVAFAASKNLLAALALVGILAMAGTARQFASLRRGQWIELIKIAIIGGSVPFALFFTGLSLASGASMASWIYRLMFFFAAIMGVALLKERPTKQVMVGVALLLAANLLIIKGISFGVGEAMVLAATVLWAYENVLLKRTLAWISPDALAAARLGIGSLTLFACIIAVRGPEAISVSTFATIPAMVSAVFILGFTMTYYRGLAKLPVHEACAILSLGGVVSALVPALLASRLPAMAEGASMLMMALGVAAILSSVSNAKNVGKDAWTA